LHFLDGNDVDDPLDHRGKAVAEEQGETEQEIPYAIQDIEDQGDEFAQDCHWLRTSLKEFFADFVRLQPL